MCCSPHHTLDRQVQPAQPHPFRPWLSLHVKPLDLHRLRPWSPYSDDSVLQPRGEWDGQKTSFWPEATCPAGASSCPWFSWTWTTLKEEDDIVTAEKVYGEDITMTANIFPLKH